MVAELKFTDLILDNFDDPTGCPSHIKLSTKLFNNVSSLFERLF